MRKPARLCAVVAGLLAAVVAFAQAPAVIKLPPAQTAGGKPLMQALKDRQSMREYSAKPLPEQVLSNLLWAANGVNRPAEKKYTASSAMNAHDVDIYVFMKDGVYLYDADTHALNGVLSGDFRSQIMMAPPPRSDTGAAARPPGAGSAKSGRGTACPR